MTCGAVAARGRLRRMTRPLRLLAALLPTLLVALVVAPIGACGGDDGGDDSGNDSNNSSADDSGGSDAMTTAQTQTSSTMETCDSSHQCVGGSCMCTTPGLENMSCTDDTLCEEECEICM